MTAAFVIWRGPELVAVTASFVAGAFAGWKAARAASRVGV